MKPELLIAGCGYVGKELIRHELDAGRRVIGVSRSAFDAEVGEVGTQCTGHCGAPENSMRDTDQVAANKLGASFQSIQADFVDRSSLPQELPWQPQVSVFLVSPGLRKGGDGEDYLRALNHWNEWCSALGIRHKIMASSIGVYEHQDGSWVNEKSLLVAESERAQRLLEAEWLFMLHTEMQREAGAVLRIGGIYGPGRHRFLENLSGGEENRDYLNLIWVEDLVSAIEVCAERMVLADNPLSGVFNVTDGSPETKDRIAAFIRGLQVSTSKLAGLSGQSESESDSEAAPSHKKDHLPAAVTSPRSPRSHANRRVSNELFRKTFGWEPQVLNYQIGYQKIKDLGGNSTSQVQ